MRTTKKLTDGREIIAREEAYGEHPHPSQRKRLVPFSGITKLLIADSTEMFECDECGWTADNIRSVASHQSAGHTPRGPMYDITVIRKVLRIVAIEKRDRGLRGSNERTAKILNDQGIATVQGKPWTPSTVHSIVAKYRDIYPVKLRKLSVVSSANAAATTDVSPKTSHTLAEIDEAVADLNRNANALVEAGVALGKKAHEIIIKLSRITEPDPVIIEKARKYDEMRGLLS
jgi:hypothetical protein